MKIAIRADGGPNIGYGHLVRTGALADYCLENGHRVTYVTATEEEVAATCPEGVEVMGITDVDAREEVVACVDRLNPTIVLADSYAVDTEYQRTIAEVSPHFIVVMDDARFRVHADCVVNGNVYADGLEYDWSGNEPTWCLGADYLLIRDEITRLAADEPPWNPSPQNAIVTMGGSDIQNRTPDVVRAFDGIDVEVDVIVGPGFQNRDKITRAAERTDAPIEVLETPDDLPRRLHRADLAVSATGSTIYELLALGTPTIGIPQTDNQEPIAESLAESDAICHLPIGAIDSLPEWIRELAGDAEKRRSLRDTGRALIDGRGTERVYRIVRELAS